MIRIKTRSPITSGTAREAGLWFALVMLVGQHITSGPLVNAQVFASAVGGVAFWFIFRFVVKSEPAG